MDNAPLRRPPASLYRSWADDETVSSMSSRDSLELPDFADEEKGLLRDDTEVIAPPRDARNPRMPVIVLVLLTILSLAAFGAGHASVSQRNTFKGDGLRAVTMDHIFNGTFAPDYGQSIQWLAEGREGDGVYTVRTASHGIELHDVKTNTSRVLVNGGDVHDRNGAALAWQDFALSADGLYILFTTRSQKRWRYSARAEYYVHDVATGTTQPLTAFADPPTTEIGVWSPHGHALAFVDKGDLYLKRELVDLAIRVTTGANLTLPWVYEEEVLSSPSAVWWSPDSTRLAFLTFDETRVPLYEFSRYDHGHGIEPYPERVQVPYPKPGTENPTADAHVYDLATGATHHLDLNLAFPALNRIVTEAAWISADEVIVKQTDRFGKHLKVVLYNIPAGAARVVRDIDYEALDGGWVEPGTTVVPLPGAVSSEVNVEDVPSGYLDIVPDQAGYRHIALFSPADSSEPLFLTSGAWEVAGAIERVDLRRKRIYYIAADPAIDRRPRYVPLPRRGELVAKPSVELTQDPGYYSISVSPEGGYHVMLYAGPGVPWSRILSADESGFGITLADNAQLNTTLASFSMPERRFKTITVNGLDFTALEILPPRFSHSNKLKHPVLFRVYGGPNSQLANSRFERDWHTYLASTLGYVVVTVDGRGTGFRGRKFRAPVAGRLGQLEAQDQVALASHYANLSYVDETAIGCWGWSYGGYLTAKVIEADSSIFTLGMSVAPVTDWLFYDSIYTERYMGDPTRNANGYAASAVQRMDGFHHSRFFLAHGSGDDNVHLLNSASLLDRLTLSKVRGFRFRMFTDSAHSMQVHGAYRELYEEMTAFLTEAWRDKATKKHAYDDV